MAAIVEDDSFHCGRVRVRVRVAAIVHRQNSACGSDIRVNCTIGVMVMVVAK